MVEVLPVLAGKDREVTLKVTKGEGGGHDAGHTSPRPTGSLATHPLDQPLPGTAPARGICLSAPTGTTTATTDVSGKAGFVYTSCEIGGVETIKADVALSGLAPQRTLTATSTVTVAVPGLADIGEQPTYVLTGGTSRHPLSTNHFALPNTNMGVLLLAFDYVQATGTILEINDMSLSMVDFLILLGTGGQHQQIVMQDRGQKAIARIEMGGMWTSVSLYVILSPARR